MTPARLAALLGEALEGGRLARDPRTQGEANAAADILLEIMGEGWSKNVWENMEWAFNIEKANLQVTMGGIRENRKFWAYISDGNGGGSEELGGGTASASTPLEACRMVVLQAQSDQDRRQKLVESAAAALPEDPRS
jgi:hypothetical protein